jgi:putative transposase
VALEAPAAVTDSDWNALVAGVRANLGAAAAETLAFIDGLPSYADVDPETRAALLMAGYDAVLSGIAARRPPGPGDEPPFEQHGEARGRRGVAISDMLSAFRFGLDALYRLAREQASGGPAREALLLEFLELGMRWTDFAMLAVVTGHRRGELALAREQQHVQTSLVRRLLSGAAAPAEIRTAARTFGLDPQGAYHAVHARLDPATTVGELERHLDVDGLHGRRKGLVTVSDGEAIGFVSELPRGASPVLMGVCGPVGLDELETAAVRARQALDAAAALGAARGRYDLETLGLHAAVVADDAVGELLVARYVTSVRAAPGGATILATVERYLANDCSIETTARDLGVHVNTVRHRLGRFDELTGRSLRAVETLTEVWWALQAVRLRPRP